MPWILLKKRAPPAGSLHSPELRSLVCPFNRAHLGSDGRLQIIFHVVIVVHTFPCFASLRHNEVRDLTANLIPYGAYISWVFNFANFAWFAVSINQSNFIYPHSGMVYMYNTETEHTQKNGGLSCKTDCLHKSLKCRQWMPKGLPIPP